VEACGGESLERVVITDSATGARGRAKALFIFIGALPRTGWLDGTVQRDAQGFLLSGPDLQRDEKGRSIKRVASGVGEGSIAVQFIHQYLSKV